jgi:hypothetical protein
MQGFENFCWSFGERMIEKFVRSLVESSGWRLVRGWVGN